MRQSDAVWNLMLKDWTSPLVALEKAKCMRFGARVYDFRRAGADIEERWAEAEGKRWKEFRFSPAFVARWYGGAAP